MVGCPRPFVITIHDERPGAFIMDRSHAAKLAAGEACQLRSSWPNRARKRARAIVDTTLSHCGGQRA
jgi:L-alanine-DL-glutamate epimerase-like enolase superfamily enzyme